MGISTYIEKRNFRKTSEPKGKKETKSAVLVFVVQKHDASHLHYDFRLEMEGVLKSWAVPKGPSMNPKDKRLAMMVEDHPYEYKDFEGTIPEGNYGAGNVIVWDKGTYHSLASGSKKEEENILLQGLKKGHITFILEGEKLKGEFALVKIKGKQENAWLLIKKQDEFASSEDVLKKDKSVISHHALKAHIKTNAKNKAVKKEQPIDPMLAEIREDPFDDGNWIFERKFDGYRVLTFIKEGTKVDLYSRNHLSFNTVFKSIAEELKKIPHSCVLDGEVVVENEKGISSFQLLQNFQKTGKGVLKYYVFDILNLNGIDLTNIPLIQRKELLEMLLAQQKLHNIYFSDFITGKGKSFYQSAVQHKMEGIIAKKSSSPYRVGKRSGEWLKIKIQQQQEAIIIGLTPPKGGRKYFGALLLGVYDEEKLEYIGKCGTGFNQQSLKEIYNALKLHFISESPLKESIDEKAVQWLQPKVVCEIKFTEWTADGNMRHPVFLGLRKDKSAMEVYREITEEKKKKIVKNEKKKSGFTNLDKIYWPQEKITKGDLIAYYTKIAPVLLPYLKNRPESLHRFPNGIKGESFFQKNINKEQSPEWIKTEKIYSSSNKEYIDYLVCNDKATLLYMANLGCIEINPWNSRTGNIDHPDWLVIDLDPEQIAFKEVVKAALETKKIFDKLKMDSFCKTSGATGLHVYVPLAGKYDYDTVKSFAQLIAQYVHEQLPATTSILRNPSKRQKKVYLDFLQNRRGQTLAAPYSVRPRAGATVSTPLKWKEVNDKLDPADFTMKNIFSRLEKVGDLWKPLLGKGADLQKALELL